MRFREDIEIVSPDNSGGVTVKGTLQSTSRSEDTSEGSISVTDWLLFLPAGTKVTHRDRIIARGMEFEVTADPLEAKNELTLNKEHHVEVTLSKTGFAEPSTVFPDEESF